MANMRCALMLLLLLNVALARTEPESAHGYKVVSQTVKDSHGNSVKVHDPLANLNGVVQKIGSQAILHGPCVDDACIRQADQLADALTLAANDPEAACNALFPVFAAPYMPQVTHVAIFNCVSFWEKQPMSMVLQGIGVLSYLEGLDDLREYWRSDPRAADTYSVWARMSYSAPDVDDVAVNKSLTAASKYFESGKHQLLLSKGEGSSDPRTDAFNSPLVHLSNAINLQLQKGRQAEAQATFDKWTRSGHAPWKLLMQRPASFLSQLQADPFPTEHGRPVPDAAALIQAHFGAIQTEFEAFLASRPRTTGDPNANVRNDGDVSRLNDKKAKCCHFQQLFFNNHGRWNDEHCRKIPTVCRLLRQHKQVSGVISADKVRSINAAGGWVPEPGLRMWVQPEHASQGSTLEESSFIKSKGHVPDLEVSILRLSPGARVIPHTGSSNARLNVHFGLKIPAGSGIKVGGQTRTWKVGVPLVFDDSFDHEAWNNADSDRVVLHMHMWNPALVPLAELRHDGDSEDDTQGEDARSGSELRAEL